MEQMNDNDAARSLLYSIITPNHTFIDGSADEVQIFADRQRLFTALNYIQTEYTLTAIYKAAQSIKWDQLDFDQWRYWATAYNTLEAFYWQSKDEAPEFFSHASEDCLRLIKHKIVEATNKMLDELKNEIKFVETIGHISWGVIDGNLRYGALLKMDDEKGATPLSILKQAIVIRHLETKGIRFTPDYFIDIYDAFNTFPAPYFTYEYSHPGADIDPDNLSSGAFAALNAKIEKEIDKQDKFVELVMRHKDYERAYNFLVSTCHWDYH